MIYLVRHAKAGDRDQWDGDDRMRPLTRAGQRQAEALLDVLDLTRVHRLLSSPYVRCIETLVPMASRQRLAIEPADALAEGASLEDASALVRKHAEHGAVLCTHGDVVPMLLSHYAEQGVDLGPHPRWPKGSTWVLHTEHNEVVAAEYVPPPGE